MDLELPESSLVAPWHLAWHGGKYRLAYITSYISEGWMGPITGYRGHLRHYDGSASFDSVESRIFKPVDIVHSWKRRPNLLRIDQAITRWKRNGGVR